MSEAKLREDAAKAVRAQHALDTVSGSLAALKAEYIKAWEASSARDTEGRERLWQAVQIVGKVESHLTQMVENGKLAERELNEISRFGDRKKILGLV
jgi:hypothetical protein